MSDHMIASPQPDTNVEIAGHNVPTSAKEINPKVASDIAYWSKEFGVTGDILHEAIRTHGTHVDKVRTALASHSVNLT